VAAKRLGMLVMALALGVAACGGDGGAATTTAVITTTTATPSTTAATTTTTAPATTAVTVPADIHPAWGVSWAEIWPPNGSTALVRVEGPEGFVEATVGLDYGVEWDGGVWDRIWLGSPEPEEFGVSFYGQRPEPWVVVVWGAHTHSGGGFEVTERFDPPLVFDLRMMPGEEVSGATTLVATDLNGEVEEGAYAWSLSLVGFEDLEVAAGRFPNTVHLHAVVEEPGGYMAETDVWIDAAQALIRLAPAHMWRSLELAGPWSE